MRRLIIQPEQQICAVGLVSTLQRSPSCLISDKTHDHGGKIHFLSEDELGESGTSVAGEYNSGGIVTDRKDSQRITEIRSNILRTMKRMV